MQIVLPHVNQVCHATLKILDVMMSAMASEIAGVSIVCSSVWSGSDQRKHQSSAPLALWGESIADRWIPLTKGELRGKYFHLMTSSGMIIAFMLDAWCAMTGFSQIAQTRLIRKYFNVQPPKQH